MNHQRILLFLFGIQSLFNYSWAESNTANPFDFEGIKTLTNTNPDSAYSKIESFSDTSYQYDYLQGLYYYRKHDFKKSRLLFLSSIEDNPNRQSSSYLDAYFYLGNDYRKLDELDSAFYYFSKIIEIEQSHKEKPITAKALNGLSIIFRQNNEIDSAIYYINKCHNEYLKLKDTVGLAGVQNTLGNIYRDFDIKLSIKHYLKALELYTLLNAEREIAITKQNLGTLFTDEGKYEVALDYLKGAYQFFLEHEYLHLQIISLNNIGFTYLNLKDYRKAEEYLLKSIKINTEYSSALAFSYLNLGSCYNEERNYSLSKKYLKQALSIAEKNNLEYLLLEIYNNLVSVSAMQNDHGNFTMYYKKYNQLQKNIQNQDIKDALAKYENQLEIIETKNLLKLTIKDQKLKQQEIEKNKTSILIRTILLAFGSLIIILLILIIFTTYKANKKQKILNIVIQKRNDIIKKYNTELETLVEERTKELEIAKKKAEESDLLKSTFLANISHEIRTPLNSIMGFSDILCTTSSNIETDNLQKYSTIIRNNGFELLSIIDDLIDVSKIEANMLTCDIENTSLSSISEAILFENSEKAKYFKNADNITFKTQFLEQDLSVKADLYKLNIVFNKLINNAFQFTEKGFIKVSSEIIENKVRFSVSDSGIGIPEERFSQILEDFRKFQNNEQITYRGLGVGLYITHHILLKMNSQLNIDSAEGQGSTFSFDLDIVES